MLAFHPLRRLRRTGLVLLGCFLVIYLLSTLSLFPAILVESPIYDDHVDAPMPQYSDVDRRDVQAALHQYVTHVQFCSNHFNCKELLKFRHSEVRRAQLYLIENNYSFPMFSERIFQTAARYCSLFKSFLGYQRTYSLEETEFPLAFSILTYQNIEELERLLRMIYAPQNIYCIHVDMKAPVDLHLAVFALTECFDNVFVASTLEYVTYAHYSRLKADMNCINDLLVRSNKWKYLLNLASSEMPLKTNLEIVRFLKKLNGSNDIREVFKFRRLERFKYRYFEFDGVLQRSNIPLPPPPHELVPTKGLAYGAMSREFLNFVTTNQIAQDFLQWSMDTHSPDEHYWATLNNLYHNSFLKSPGGFRDHPDRMPFKSRHIVWKNTAQRCHGKYRHNICVFGLGDIPSLKISNKLIANKFDLLYDPVAYACMEEHLRNKSFGLSKN